MTPEQKTQVDAFLALPKEERRATYNNLSKEIQLLVRRELEKTRGIAYRLEGGQMVLTKEAYTKHVLRLEQKAAEMPARLQRLQSKINGMKQEMLEFHGQEAYEALEGEIESAAQERAAANANQ